MKLSLFIILFLVVFSSESICQINDQSELTVTITNIKNITGKIQIGLYNELSDFPATDGQYRVIFEEVTSDEVVSIIRDLPEGDYGIAVYQDENEDDECNKNFIGIPKEPYGFSTNFRPRFRAPKFDNVRFSFPAESVITIKLVH